MSTASLHELTVRSQKDRDNPRVYHHLAVRLLALGQADKAREAFARAVELDPEDEDARLGLATAASAIGNDQEAFNALNNLIANNPKSARGHYMLALFCQEKGLLSKGYDEAKTASSLDPTNAPALRLAGLIAAKLRNYAEAEKALRRATELNSKDWRSRLALGDVLTALHRSVESTDSFRQAVSLAPDEVAPMLALGTALVRPSTPQSDLAEAQKLLAKAVSKDPGSASAQAVLGRCLTMEGRFQDARRPLEEAIRLAPNVSVVHYDLQQVYQNLGLADLATREGDLHHSLKSYEEQVLSLGGQIRAANSSGARLSLARLYAQHGDYIEAAREYQTLIAHAPETGTARSELAQVMMRLRAKRELAGTGAISESGTSSASGDSTKDSAANLFTGVPSEVLLRDSDALLKDKRYADAEGAYRQLIVRPSPKSIEARAYQGLGLALNGQGKNEDAFQALNHAIGEDESLTEARFVLARLYFEVGFEDQAAHHLEVAVRQAPANAQYLHALGTCYVNDPPKYLRAEEVLKKANDLTPGRPLYLRDLANIEEKLNELSAAEIHLRQALNLAQNDAATLDALGAFLLNHNPSEARRNEAKSLFDASVLQTKGHPAALMGLGRIALDTGDSKSAVSHFEKAVLLAPGDSALWYKLATAYDRLGNRERADACRAAFRDIDGYNADLSHTEELARTNLKDPELRLKLARLYARGAQNARAINQYQMCLSLNPNFPAAKNELAKLVAKLKAEGHMPQMTTFNGMVIASVPSGAGAAKQ